jgi:hypothetical protein
MQPLLTPDNPREKFVLQKMRMLSERQILQLLDFVESLSQQKQDERLRRAGNTMAEDAFKKVWDNAEDDVYDRI